MSVEPVDEGSPSDEFWFTRRVLHNCPWMSMLEKVIFVRHRALTLEERNAVCAEFGIEPDPAWLDQYVLHDGVITRKE